MSKTTTLFIGLDVHRDSIPAAYAEDERGSELVLVGQIGPCHSDIGPRHLILPTALPHPRLLPPFEGLDRGCSPRASRRNWHRTRNVPMRVS
jgi:hypothetical protein